MDDNGEMREDLKLPEGDLGKEIRERHSKDDTSFLVSCSENIFSTIQQG